MLSVFAALLATAQTISLSSGMSVVRVTEGGRLPVARDQVLAELVTQGSSYTPTTSKLPWKEIKANSEGWFEGINSGYLAVTFNAPKAGPMLLEAAGHGMVYINGEPRTGDPYGYGYVKLPFWATEGPNTFLFSGGRGRVKASVSPSRSVQQLDSSDLTMPDIIPTDGGELTGAIVVLNNSDRDSRDLTISASANGKTTTTQVPTVGPFTFRKVPFKFPVTPTDDLEVKLMSKGVVLDTTALKISHKKVGEHYRRTFISDIDGSVQYFGVSPALKPSEGNGLVLSLHGASVEGIGQAQAYTPKSNYTLVAATNRRPYGFDWEDWGRLDALEVLGIAQKMFPHDPAKVYVTGHSMGGHGTWHVGTLFPDRFAAMAPSAGWISFWSYGGGWEPRDANAVESLVRSAMNPSDTLQRIRNTADLGVYILHGDADDNVPVGQARTGRAALRPWHRDVGYHEQPGAGHWFGNESVDWPGIFQMFDRRQRQAMPSRLRFITPNPAISGKYYWATIHQAIDPRQPSSIDLTLNEPSWVRRSVEGSTANVAALELDIRSGTTVTLDGQRLDSSGLYQKVGSAWRPLSRSALAREKNAKRGGPYKQAYQNRMKFVYPTAGTAEENAASYAKARYDAETFYYRGNGSVDVVPDTAVASTGDNLILYGNADTNKAWKQLLANAPIRVQRGKVRVGDKTFEGLGLASLFLVPSGSGNRLIGVVGATGPEGSRLADRLPVFVSGVAYPDWVVVDTSVLSNGTKAMLGAGYFDNRWQLNPLTTAWK